MLKFNLLSKCKKAFSDIASKRMHLVIQKFLTFPKYQKQKFWKNLNSNFFTPPPLEGGTKKLKKFKLVLEPTGIFVSKLKAKF